jgi:hypothetical protein
MRNSGVVPLSHSVSDMMWGTSDPPKKVLFTFLEDPQITQTKQLNTFRQRFFLVTFRETANRQLNTVAPKCCPQNSITDTFDAPSSLLFCISHVFMFIHRRWVQNIKSPTCTSGSPQFYASCKQCPRTIFIVAPCILKINQLLKTNKCTTIYCVYSKIRIKTLKKLLHVSIYRSSSV